jgi:DNA-binding transcriptional ArsR family regulator
MSAHQPSPVAEVAAASKLQARWGVAMTDGFLVVPRVLLLKQRELDLDNGEVMVLLNLFAHWWDDADHPYPAVSSMAQRMGLSIRTVQRTLEKLEKRGFIERLRNTRGNGRSSELRVTRYALHGAVAKIKAAWGMATPRRPPPVPSEFNGGIRVTPNEGMMGFPN